MQDAQPRRVQIDGQEPVGQLLLHTRPRRDRCCRRVSAHAAVFEASRNRPQRPLLPRQASSLPQRQHGRRAIRLPPESRLRPGARLGWGEHCPVAATAGPPPGHGAAPAVQSGLRRTGAAAGRLGPRPQRAALLVPGLAPAAPKQLPPTACASLQWRRGAGGERRAGVAHWRRSSLVLLQSPIKTHSRQPVAKQRRGQSHRRHPRVAQGYLLRFRLSALQVYNCAYSGRCRQLGWAPATLR